MTPPYSEGSFRRSTAKKSKTTSYEVYVMRNTDWIVDSIHADRYGAVGEARDLLRRPGVKMVRVIEERFDEVTGESLAAIVFRQSANENKDAPTFKRRPRPVVSDPMPKVVPKQAAAVRSLGLMLVMMGGLGVSALIGLAFLLDYMK